MAGDVGAGGLLRDDVGVAKEGYTFFVVGMSARLRGPPSAGVIGVWCHSRDRTECNAYAEWKLG